MRTTSILVAALAAVSTVAAQDNRPKIYFPKYVKRQFGNSTSSNELPSGEPAASSSAPPAEESTPPPRVTTIVIASTIYVPPPPPSEAPASSLPVTTLPSSAPSAGGAASSGSVPSVIVTPTSRSSAAPASSSAPAASSPDTSSPAASSPAASSVPHTSSALTIAPTGVVSSAASSTPVLTSTTTTPVDPLTSFLSQVVSELTSALLPTPSSTESPSVAPTTTSSSVAASSPAASSPAASSPATSDPITLLPSLSLTLLPSLSISVPPILPTTSTSVIPSGSGITGGGTGSAPITSTPVSTPPPISTPPPPPVTNVTESVPPTTLPPTTAPVSLNTTATEPPPVSVPTTAVPPPVSVNTTATANATVVPPPASATSEEPATTTSGVYSILPTATVSNSAPFLPTTLIIGAAPLTTSGASAPTTATSIPTTLPKAITPDTGSQPQPADTTLIQIGFLYGMNYAFVASNGKAAAQIFQLLPQALSYAGGFDVDKAQVQKLVPLNTYQSLGYATTLAVVSYPSDLIDTLRMDVRIPTSSLYNNPEQLVYNLTMEINPAIDIVLGSYPADGGSAAGPSPSGATANPSPNSDPFNGNDATSSPESSTQRGTTVGIVTGSVAVAAAYGAVMFILARRYKRKKQAHRRASSISSPSEMRQTGSPALMGGAHLSRDFTDSYGAAGGRDSHGSGRSGMGNSGRTAYISAPVAAENSLGWN